MMDNNGDGIYNWVPISLLNTVDRDFFVQPIVRDELNTDAVSTVKIVDKNVTEPKLADDAVSTRTIVNNSITSEKIADGAITTTLIGEKSVTFDKLQDYVSTTLMEDGKYDGSTYTFNDYMVSINKKINWLRENSNNPHAHHLGGSDGDLPTPGARAELTFGDLTVVVERNASSGTFVIPNGESCSYDAGEGSIGFYFSSPRDILWWANQSFPISCSDSLDETPKQRMTNTSWGWMFRNVLHYSGSDDMGFSVVTADIYDKTNDKLYFVNAMIWSNDVSSSTSRQIAQGCCIEIY